jgi:hypothetical protein
MNNRRRYACFAAAAAILSLVSCSLTGGVGVKTPTPILSFVETTAHTSSPMPKISETIPTNSAQDMVYTEKVGIFSWIDKRTGLSLEYPSEFNHVMNYTGENDAIKCAVYFDFKQEPFNGEYTESCSSFISIRLSKHGQQYDLKNISRPYNIIKTDDGTNLYVVGKYEETSAVGFDFAKECPSDAGLLQYTGTVEVSPAFYKRYETAIMNMLKSMTIVKNPGSVVSTPQPSGDMYLENRTNGTYLLVNQFGWAFQIPDGFDQILSYSGYKDFAILSFDFTKPPFNEPYNFNIIENINLKSRIDICFYRGMNGKYPEYLGYSQYIVFQHETSTPDFVLINMLKTDKTVNFDFEMPGRDCGGSVSVSRAFYDKYGAIIINMLYPGNGLY